MNSMLRLYGVLCCIVLFSVGNLGAAGNAYVSVEPISKPGLGSIAEPYPNEFHITTCDVEDNFSIEVRITALYPYVFSMSETETITEKTITLGVGGTAGWSVVSTENEGEESVSGLIILFKVDVQIDGVGEEDEVTEGALVDYASCADGYNTAACRSLFKPVSIRCLPSNRPDEELIILSFTSHHLLEKVDGEYVDAQSDYKIKELGQKTFALHGHDVSGAMRDCSVVATHNVNCCTDSAKYTIIQCEFTAFADPPGGQFIPVIALLEIEMPTFSITQNRFDVGHACWKINVEPKVLLDEAILSSSHLKEYVNKPTGFYPDRPDVNDILSWIQVHNNGKWWRSEDWEFSLNPVTQGKIEMEDPHVGPYNHSWRINPFQAKSSLTMVKTLYETLPQYNLYNNNCANVTIQVGGAAGVAVPNLSATETLSYALSFRRRENSTIAVLRLGSGAAVGRRGRVNLIEFGPATPPGLMARELQKLNQPR